MSNSNMATTDQEQNMKEFLKAFKRAQNNAVFFLEFWNRAFPKKKIELSDEEKQKLFEEHRCMVPLIDNFEDFHKYQAKLDELRKQGYKDWEIF